MQSPTSKRSHSPSEDPTSGYDPGTDTIGEDRVAQQGGKAKDPSVPTLDYYGGKNQGGIQCGEFRESAPEGNAGRGQKAGYADRSDSDWSGPYENITPKGD